jgi:S1-C subfamily serine protease
MDDLFNGLGGDRIGNSVTVRTLRGGELVELTISPTAHP